jgi:hypothetical protein
VEWQHERRQIVDYNGPQEVGPMRDSIRLKLHFGPYRTPRFRMGAVVEDEVRGSVRIVKMTDAPIPWPIGKAKDGRLALVVFGGLAKAVRRESGVAVCHWWGVSWYHVNNWRRALGVASSNEGTYRLRLAFTRTPRFRQIQKMAWALNGTPERRAAQSLRQTGMKMSEQARRNNSFAHIGIRNSEATRRKLSLAHKRRGTWPPAAGKPWSEDELALHRSLPPKEVVKRTNRTYSAVTSMRVMLGLSRGRNRKRRSRSSPLCHSQ